MKLVASASGSSKLPAAETCALDDGEDDDDDDLDDDDDDGDFAAAKVRKGARFFHKLKMSSGPNSGTKVRHGHCSFRLSETHRSSYRLRSLGAGPSSPLDIM